MSTWVVRTPLDWGAGRTLRSPGVGAGPRVPPHRPPLGLPVWRCSHWSWQAGEALRGERPGTRDRMPARPYLQVLHLVLLQGHQGVEVGQAPLQRQLIAGHRVQGHKIAPAAVVQGALQHQVLGQAPLQAGVCRAGEA